MQRTLEAHNERCAKAEGENLIVLKSLIYNYL
jgi:hypothetical protein